MQTINEKSLNRIISRNFPDHGKKMIPVAGVVTHRVSVRRDLPEMSKSRHINGSPFRMGNCFHIADPSVEICGNGNSFSGTGFCKLSEQIIGQGRVFDPDFRIVISHSLIAAGMKTEIIRTAAFELVCKIFRIKIFSDVRIIKVCVIVVKQSVLYLMHAAPLLRMIENIRVKYLT